MPDERDIEKALRAWAKRRREEAGAPVELHPATRRLLQAEAARLKGGHERGSVARWLWGSPLRLVLNFSAVAVLVVAAALLLQPHHPSATFSAGREVVAEDKRNQNENPMNGDFVETEQNSRDVSKTKAGSNRVFLGDNLAAARKDTTPASAVPGAAPPTPILANEVLPKNSPPPETATATAAAAPAVMPPATDMEAVAAAPAVQRFFWVNSPTNTDTHGRVAAKKLPAAPLLGSFRTEQTGNRLRVIDADGSVYTGALAAARAQSSNPVVSAVQTRSFRVSGTNVTTHQRVVFAGRLVLGVQPQPTAPTGVGGGTIAVNGTAVGGGGGGFGGAGYDAGGRQTNTPATAGTVLQSLVTSGATPAQPQFRLEGTVRIGTNQIPVNAVPVAP